MLKGSQMKGLKVGILGATGLVGRAAVAAVAKNSSGLELGTLVGSTASTGAAYRAVWERKEQDLVDHYGEAFWTAMPYEQAIGDRTVGSFEDLLAGDDDVVFSSIPLRAGSMEDELLASGKFVVSNSPYRRYEPDVPVIVSEVNGLSVLRKDSRYIKSPNCCTNGIVLAIKPIVDKFGIEACDLTTYQSITGRGDLKYEPHLVKGNVYPIGRTEENTEEFIKREVRKIFIEEDFPISVSCQRVMVQRNHFIDVKLRLKTKPGSVDEVHALWREFNPFESINAEGVFSHTCERPLTVVDQIGYPRPVLPDNESNLGMSVMVGNTDVSDEIHDLRFKLVVDNIDRGAFGGPLQNAQLVLNYLNNSALCETQEHNTQAADATSPLEARAKASAM